MLKVSIIIPVYNVAPYIERCLLSVLNQSYTNIEIILIDDCSTDTSSEIAKQIIDSHINGNKAIIKYHETNKGLSAARNRGIIESTGDYLYLLDSDDSITEECIELLVNSVMKYNSDIAIGDYNCIGGTKPMPPLKIEGEYLSSSKDIVLSFQREQWYPMAVNKLINRRFLINNNLFFKEGIVHEDELWSFMIACQATNMSIIHEKTYLYYLRSDSITGLLHNKEKGNRQRQLGKSNESKIQIVRYMYEYIKDRGLNMNKIILLTYEIKKETLFYTIFKTRYFPHKDLYKIYLEFRSMVYPNTIGLLISNAADFKSCVKLSHYLLPKLIGFKYYISLAKFRK